MNGILQLFLIFNQNGYPQYEFFEFAQITSNEITQRMERIIYNWKYQWKCFKMMKTYFNINFKCSTIIILMYFFKWMLAYFTFRKFRAERQDLVTSVILFLCQDGILCYNIVNWPLNLNSDKWVQKTNCFLIFAYLSIKLCIQIIFELLLFMHWDLIFIYRMFRLFISYMKRK